MPRAPSPAAAPADPPARGPGRPKLGDRHQIRIDQATADTLRQIGGGNLTMGLRECVRRLVAAGLVDADRPR